MKSSGPHAVKYSPNFKEVVFLRGIVKRHSLIIFPGDANDLDKSTSSSVFADNETTETKANDNSLSSTHDTSDPEVHHGKNEGVVRERRDSGMGSSLTRAPR
jgi:hypothetical protein